MNNALKLAGVSRSPETRIRSVKSAGILVLILTLSAAGGCKKSETPPPASTGGVQRMDLAKIDQVFKGAPPEVMNGLDTMETSYRYGNYEAALGELDKLEANAALTDAQKKYVSQLKEQVKQAQTAPPPGQGTSPSNQ